MLFKKIFFKSKKNDTRDLPQEKNEKNIEEIDASPKINFIKQKIAPLKLDVSEEFKTKINILISIIDFRYFFAGYISIFNIAQKLVDQGKTIRIIIVDCCDFDPNLWRKEIKKYSGLEQFFDKVELEYVYDRSNLVQVNSDDVFLATSWWTAHIANDTLKYLNHKKFIFLIQEYEPVFYSHDILYVLSQQAYTFPHFAVFSTEFLSEYFKQNCIGVFKEKTDDVEINSIYFENAIIKFEINKNTLEKKDKMKLLFYARPENHAARNLFELGVLALSEAIKNNCFDSTIWEFHGIGSITKYKNIKLYGNIEMKLLPRVSLDEYKKLLPEYDIGLSLMLTPHPNLLTLDMASAGMIVVTNSFENKNQKSLSKISSNILVAEPSIKDIEHVLCEAVKKVGDFENRIKGSKVNWATSWNEALNEDKMKKILHLFDIC